MSQPILSSISLQDIIGNSQTQLLQIFRCCIPCMRSFCQLPQGQNTCPLCIQGNLNWMTFLQRRRRSQHGTFDTNFSRWQLQPLKTSPCHTRRSPTLTGFLRFQDTFRDYMQHMTLASMLLQMAGTCQLDTEGRLTTRLLPQKTNTYPRGSLSTARRLVPL